MPLTKHSRKKLGDGSMNKAAFPSPTNMYAALFASDPGAAGTQTSELTFTGYARIEVTSKFGAFDADTGIALSTAEISFGIPGSNDSPAAYVGILDASSAGNMWYREALPNPRAVVSGAAALKWKAGQLSIQLI